MSIAQYMTNDHRDCDDAFVKFENAINEQNWEELRLNWSLFVDKLYAHFEMEEEVLFPAFEAATGMTQGPTAVMRSEHAQMRAMVDEIAEALTNEDSDDCQGVAETLMIMMQQHNMKEEQILYPMTDMRTQSDEVLEEMKGLHA